MQQKLDDLTQKYIEQKIGVGINLAFWDGIKWLESSRGLIDNRLIIPNTLTTAPKFSTSQEQSPCLKRIFNGATCVND